MEAGALARPCARVRARPALTDRVPPRRPRQLGRVTPAASGTEDASDGGPPTPAVQPLPPLPPIPWALAALASLILAVGMFLHVRACALAPVAYVIAIKRAGCLLSVVWGWCLFGERGGLRPRLASALLMVGGVLLIVL